MYLILVTEMMRCSAQLTLSTSLSTSPYDANVTTIPASLPTIMHTEPCIQIRVISWEMVDMTN